MDAPVENCRAGYNARAQDASTVFTKRCKVRPQDNVGLCEQQYANAKCFSSAARLSFGRQEHLKLSAMKADKPDERKSK
jgi:hypothetical protein